MIENLVFKGGGVKGIAYAGALDALDHSNILPNIKRCAGTSAGAIVAALVCIGYNYKEIKEILETTNFSSFKDCLNPIRLIFRYGIFKGNVFKKWLENLIIKKGYSKDITFKELFEKTNKGLYVFALNLNTRNIQGFSVDYTPDVKISDAVRASMSIPMFFKAWKISNLKGLFVDGGVAYNYPISVFDNDMFLNSGETYNKRTLGFYLDTKIKNKEIKNSLKFNEPINYIKELLITIMDVEVINFKRRLVDVNRTVFIDDFAISFVEFDITKENIEKLYKSGFDCTISYLSKLKK
jgi:NTE family protein